MVRRDLIEYNITEGLCRNKQGVETLAVAFSDHMAVLLRVYLTIPFVHRGRGRWRINIFYLAERAVQKKVSEGWVKWKKTYTPLSRHCQMVVQYAERRIQTLFVRRHGEELRPSQYGELHLCCHLRSIKGPSSRRDQNDRAKRTKSKDHTAK
jgi:hypothetical protein